MSAAADDPAAMMFTCDRCGHWPMAFQTHDPLRRVARFVCGKCHAHIGHSVRAASRTLSAVGEHGSARPG